MRKLHWWGWILFLASSLFYLTIGIRDGDWLMTGGSAAFALGVLLLMTPDRSSDPGEASRPERHEQG